MSPPSPLYSIHQAGVHSMKMLQGSPHQKNCSSCHNSSPTHSERSLAFKRWARGRCYRCLATDHQVRSCKDAFRCIRCRNPGHRERHCRFQSATTSPQVDYPMHCHPEPAQIPQQTQNWTDVVQKCHFSLATGAAAESPVQGNHTMLSGSQPVDTLEKVVDQICCSSGSCSVHHALASLDPKSIITHVLELLRSELHHLIVAHMEEVMRPLREEVSTVKLWLARVSNRLEHADLDREHLSASNMAELFGPCSPVRISPTPMISASLVEECKAAESQVCEDVSTNITNEPIPLTQTVEVPSVEIHGEKHFGTDEMTTRASCTELPQEMPVDEFAAVTATTCTSQVQVEQSEELKLLENVDQVGGVAIVQDESDHEPISNAYVMSKDPISLITIDDGPTQHSTKVENAQLSKLSSSFAHTTAADYKNIAFSPSVPKGVKCRRKLHARSSLRRKAHIGQENMLRDLGVVGDNGRLDEDKLQEYADCVKEMLPPNLLMTLLSMKGRAFWDMMAALTSHLR